MKAAEAIYIALMFIEGTAAITLFTAANVTHEPMWTAPAAFASFCVVGTVVLLYRLAP